MKSKVQKCEENRLLLDENDHEIYVDHQTAQEIAQENKNDKLALLLDPKNYH